MLSLHVGFLVAESVRICLQCKRPGFGPWVGKILWRRKWQPTPVFLLGKSHARGALVGYSPWGYKESNMAEHVLLYCIVHILQDTGKLPQERMIWYLMPAVLRLRNPVLSLTVFWGTVVNCRLSAVSRGSNSKAPADVGMWEPSIQEKNQRKN